MNENTSRPYAKCMSIKKIFNILKQVFLCARNGLRTKFKGQGDFATDRLLWSTENKQQNDSSSFVVANTPALRFPPVFPYETATLQTAACIKMRLCDRGQGVHSTYIYMHKYTNND